MDDIAANDADISGLDDRVTRSESDITVLDMMVCDNMAAIATNAA